ncbi:uncharacterized protein LOC114881326 [Osmia bicornis bicornis]|uniref:uncharacterized protein LOC114881326 n=1 Tax=Osmia bicornis bicornis TaxID=1437191 RepID=UPI0010F435AC|nr:uncharacterized protein LOC114881326 [Osmia bicornis bicornis]
METLAITVESDEGETDLILVYRNPSKNTTTDQWRGLIDNLEAKERTIILDDMNAKNTEWNCVENDTQGVRLANVMEEGDVFIANRDTLSRPASGSHRASNIDLVLLKYEMLQTLSVENSGITLGSDHQIVNIVMDITIPPANVGNRFSTRKYGFKKINWKVFHTKMEETAENIAKEASDTATEADEKLLIREAIYKGLEESGATKKKQPPNRQGRTGENREKKQNKQRWWDDDCNKAREEKRRALMAFNRHPNEETWKTYKINDKKIKATIKKKRKQAWEKFAENVNHSSDCKSLWEQIKGIQKGRKPTYKKSHDGGRKKRGGGHRNKENI